MHGGIQIIQSELLQSNVAWRQKPDLMYCGERAYRAILWEAGERARWDGRDRRRVKRERRKFIAERS